MSHSSGGDERADVGGPASGDVEALRVDNARLRAANTRLREVGARRDAELDAARRQVEMLRAQVEALAARVGEQDERIAELTARARRDSSNSSLPPSQEGLAKKPAKPRTRGGRRGKRPGAPGTHLAQVADPDEVVEHAPESCQGCGRGLGDAAVVGAARRQVFDLPAVRARVTEHRAQTRRCGCGTTTSAGFPSEARAPACYGPRLRALIAYLTVFQHLPVDRCARLLGDVAGIQVATGTIAAVAAQAAARVAPSVDAIRAALGDAGVACFDETGARVDGRLAWIHSASTDTLTLYTAHAKRGVAAMDAAAVLPAFTGVAVHDGWAPYRRYTAAAHALCNAHLVRELTAVAETGQDWAGHLIDTLVAAKDHVDAARTAGADRLDPELLAAIRARYDGHVAQGRDAHRAPPGRRRRPKPAALVERLERHRDEVLCFTTDFAVPWDNNQAERDLRMIKLQQKISGCWRTLAGAQAFLAVRSYISTARKHGRNVLDVLRDAFTDQPWTPTPALAQAA